MYIFFLTFRYLTRKAIVIFPILVVTLCVAMMIIVTSIMGGFVERVRQANRELSGDIIISSRDRAGWPYYEKVIDAVTKLPEVTAATPVIYAYGLLNVGGGYHGNTGVQVVGIDPAGRAAVSAFRQTLFYQYRAPEEAAEDLAPYLPATGDELQKKAEDLQTDAGAQNVAAHRVLLKLEGDPKATDRQKDRAYDQTKKTELTLERSERTWEYAQHLASGKKYATLQDLRDALIPAAPSFEPPAEAQPKPTASAPMPRKRQGIIIGADVGLLGKRDRQGNWHRNDLSRNVPARITVVPVTTRGGFQTPRADDFIIIDDSYTRVYDVDATYVYAPFATVQKMAEMNQMAVDEKTDRPARTNEVLIKIKNGDDPKTLAATRDKIQQAVDQVLNGIEDYNLRTVNVQTWEEKQAQYIRAVENEKRMLTFILGLMSMVVLVVIFLIFYMIVRDKTKDIGILKALGASEEGVAGIFVMYGLFVGAVGGLAGMTLGVTFMHHTNEIHEWIYQTTGMIIWDRSIYLFDRIPDTVNPWEVGVYVVSALIAGWLGAMIPAIVAGAQDPIKAVRYE